MRSEAPVTSGPGQAVPRHALVVLAIMFALTVVGFALGPVLGTAARTFAQVGVMLLPLALLAVAGYAGEDDVAWARIVSVLLLAVIALVMTVGFAAQAGELIEARGADAGADADAIRGVWLVAIAGFMAAALVFWRPVRRALARVLPIDEDRFVHTLALAAAIAITTSAFAPLVILGEPPLTALAALGPAPEGEPAVSSLYEHLFQLLWTVPTCLLLVGYGLRRSLSGCLERLGLVVPGPRDIGRALALAMGLVIVALGAGWLVSVVFDGLGWAVTDEGGIDELMADIISPTGALVVGVSAGLGEELVVRGVLQPRLGILLSNLVFTAMHAGQYGWDLLFVIFCVGTAFGLVRKYSNTTMSAMAHGFYDIILILAATAAR